MMVMDLHLDWTVKTMEIQVSMEVVASRTHA